MTEFGPSTYDAEHVGDIVAGEGTWFSARLLRLIAKADMVNRERLRLGFPEHVDLYESWHSTQSYEKETVE